LGFYRRLGDSQKVDADDLYPLSVEFDDEEGSRTFYTADGRLVVDGNRSLFFQAFAPPPYVLEKPKPDLKVDDKVLVRNCKATCEDHDWEPAHFAEWCDNGIRCFISGQTSWTNGRIPLEWWKFYKLPEGE
jgi:hypothetical protein